MRFLVSGGPTHEYLDDVRFLGNPSTGRMGIAVAAAATELGHSVTLVLGPTELADPPGVEVLRVVSALEMREALVAGIDRADAVVMTAAVADYRPKYRVGGKIKKGADALVLELVKNPDILQEIGTMSRDRVLVGFALEAAPLEEALRHAREKLLSKNCDLIVLNRTGSLGGGRGEDVVLVARGEAITPLGTIGKRELAERLVRFCEDAARGRGHAGVDRKPDAGGHGPEDGQGRRRPSSRE